MYVKEGKIFHVVENSHRCINFGFKNQEYIKLNILILTFKGLCSINFQYFCQIFFLYSSQYSKELTHHATVDISVFSFADSADSADSVRPSDNLRPHQDKQRQCKQMTNYVALPDGSP